MSNITEVTFTTERYAVTEPLYQYDYGQVLKITAPSLPDPYTVHFGNTRSSGESLTVIGTASDGAAIPSALLATGLNVYAWVFLHTGENDGETEYMIEIPVIKRAEPTDDPVIEEDPSAVDIIMGEISSLKEDIENISGISDDVKTALLQIAAKVAYIDANGQTYYNALYNALYPPANLVSISAAYTQTSTVYETTPLEDLKNDLVVTAIFDDSTTTVLQAEDYTLSGTLTEGTSTITASYSGKTDTFDVTVSDEWMYKWIPSDGTLDSKGFTTAANSGTMTYEEDGLKIVGVISSSTCPKIINPIDNTYKSVTAEYVMNWASFVNNDNSGFGLQFTLNGSKYANIRVGSKNGTCRYTVGAWTYIQTSISTAEDHTVRVEYVSNGKLDVYIDSVSVLSVNVGNSSNSDGNIMLCLGGTYKLKSIKVKGVAA